MGSKESTTNNVAMNRQVQKPALLQSKRDSNRNAQPKESAASIQCPAVFVAGTCQQLLLLSVPGSFSMFFKVSQRKNYYQLIS